MNQIDLNKKCFFLVTGASRGIGQEMSIQCSKFFKPGSVVLLLARSAAGLEETKIKINSQNSALTIITCSIDLTDPTSYELENIIKTAIGKNESSEFELAFVIHNIGSIGDTTKRAIELNDKLEWQNFLSLNFTSVITLNTEFLKNFPNSKKLIVNITSKAAIAPFKSFSHYCCGKSIREMYFRVLAEEEPEIVVLNYSPGVVDTDMVTSVQTNSMDEVIRSYFESLKKSNEILKPEQTTLKMINVLELGNFKSGDRVDYYDV